jgi:drug/metabolite transporter (DMT)-like permease
LKLLTSSLKPGVAAALVSAFLFGAGTPLAKWLLDQMSPWILAGLLYLGSGLGLFVYRLARGAGRPRLNPGEMRWFVAAVVCGGGIAPVLLMYGLSAMPSSHAALLLNAEAVLTAVLAWMVFKENFDRRIAAGMAAIVLGALLLSWPRQQAADVDSTFALLWPAFAVLLACFFWALDNNFTRKISLADASWIACVKGLAAGVTNLVLAFLAGAMLPGLGKMTIAMGVGLLAYGVSLALFVVGLRHLGTARAGAYFSTAPFVGALFSVMFLAEPVTWQLLVAAALMAFGVWLHLTEHHAHAHTHEALEHEHAHMHDEHHPHEHVPAVAGKHSHPHKHEPVTHNHEHYPDAHHRHGHQGGIDDGPTR